MPAFLFGQCPPLPLRERDGFLRPAEIQGEGAAFAHAFMPGESTKPLTRPSGTLSRKGRGENDGR